MGHLVKRSLGVFSLTAFLVVLGLFMGPGNAQADPHAVFLTVVGQQQFFFNVLAALNQADYVESLLLRQQLAKKRDDANYLPSSAAALRESQTDLAALVARTITPSGRDTFTEERGRDYAQEVVRQQRLAVLIDQLCREAFGEEQCQFKEEDFKENSNQLLNERERAFIQDPVLFRSLPVQLGALGALYSGTVERDETAEEILTLPSNGGPALPYAYSTEIAEFRTQLREAGKTEVLDKFDLVVDEVASEYLPPQFDLAAWTTELTTDNKGNVEFCEVCFTAGPFELIARYGSATNAVTTLRDDLRTIADEAEARVAIQLQDTVVDGAVPDRVHKTSQGVASGVGHNIGEVGTLVSAPANVKVGLQRELLPLLAQIEANPQFIDPSQIENPAGESAVDRTDEQGNDKPPLKIGAPLEEFAKADVIEKGLFQQSGITEKPFKLKSHNLLQGFLEKILFKI